MTFPDFKNSLQNTEPPTSLTIYLIALWYDGKGNWEKAHEMIQDLQDKNAALIHAYLHRKEGDIWNADYWYQKAKQKRPDLTLAQEWENICKGLLDS